MPPSFSPPKLCGQCHIVQGLPCQLSPWCAGTFGGNDKFFLPANSSWLQCKHSSSLSPNVKCFCNDFVWSFSPKLKRKSVVANPFETFAWYFWMGPRAAIWHGFEKFVVLDWLDVVLHDVLFGVVVALGLWTFRFFGVISLLRWFYKNGVKRADVKTPKKCCKLDWKLFELKSEETPKHRNVLYIPILPLVQNFVMLNRWKAQGSKIRERTVGNSSSIECEDNWKSCYASLLWAPPWGSVPGSSLPSSTARMWIGSMSGLSPLSCRCRRDSCPSWRCCLYVFWNLQLFPYVRNRGRSKADKKQIQTGFSVNPILRNCSLQFLKRTILLYLEFFMFRE